MRLIVRRVRPTPGSQLALFVEFSHHGFITDRAGDTLELEADHRRHAVVEDAIRDLKYGVGLNHLPSGRFGANAAWLGLNVIAHNLARWTSRLGLGETLIATDTLRRRHLRTPGRITRSARKPTLHLPRPLAMGRTVQQLSRPAPRRRAHHLTPADLVAPPTNAGARTRPDQAVARHAPPQPTVALATQPRPHHPTIPAPGPPRRSAKPNRWIGG